MRNRLFLCGSYGQVYHYLPLLGEASSVLVVLENPDLFRFFLEFGKGLSSNTLDILYQDGNYRTFYRSHLKSLEDYDVYFMGRGFSGPLIYLLGKLRKKNNLVYISYKPDYTDRYRLKSPLDIGRLLRVKFKYGILASLGTFPGVPRIPYISDKFLRREISRTISTSDIRVDLRSYNSLDKGDYTVLYLVEDLVMSGEVTDRVRYREELSLVLDLLVKYFNPKEVAVKYHPHYPTSIPTIEVGEVVSRYIPAELLPARLYLGITSSALTRVQEGTVVSLLDLVTFDKPNLKEWIRSRLVSTTEKGRIQFPKSLKDLEEIFKTKSRRLHSDIT